MSKQFQSQSQPQPQSQSQEEEQKQQKQRIMVPPMIYPLEGIHSSEMFGYFKCLTTTGCFPTDEAKAQANTFLDIVKTNPTKIWIFGYMPAPPHSEITRRVIGKDGYYFKMTTTLSEVNFIWHNRVNNTFLFWGTTNFKVVSAMNAIRWRIHKVYSIHTYLPQTEEISDDEH